LETIALKCMEKEPRSRYQNAGELADELERFLTHRPIAARPIGRMERSWRWCKRHPLVASLTAGIIAALAIGLAGVTWQWLATKRAEQGRTVAQVESLLSASPEAIPTLLSSLAPYRSEVAPVLRRRLSDTRISADEKLRAHLGLLADDASHAEPLFESLFTGDMSTFLLVRDQLLASPVRLEQRCVTLLKNGDLKPDVRFRAACFLAAAPQIARTAWNAHANFIADQLLTEVLERPSEYAALSNGLSPMAAELVAPLADVYRDAAAAESRRRAATHLLADYAKDESITLANLLLDAEPWQFSILMPIIAGRHRTAAVDYLAASLSTDEPTKASTDSLDTLTKKRANAAIALIQLGSAHAAWPLLASNADMSARSYFIDRFARAGASAEPIIQRIPTESDTAVRRALYLTLGGFSTSDIREARLAALKPTLISSFRDDPDGGIHAAVRWLLTQWNLKEQVGQAESELAKLQLTSATQNGGWHVNSENHTMLLHGPATFQMGSPPDEPGRYQEEPRHERHIDRTFAIAMCETTIAQYQEFDPDWRHFEADESKDRNCPVYFVSYNRAAAYCNWLSQREGIPNDQWCYVEEPGRGEFLKEAENCLTLLGYRLPTEAEWEYACRAGTTTARFFGHSAELLPKYAWCPANSPLGRKHPVALKKPNDAGLFDVYGNVDEICHDRLRDSKGGAVANLIVTRGGAAGDLLPPRSALRNFAFNDPDNPNQGGLAMGFRVAKSIAVEPTAKPEQ
jgi:formylglycine-generating enzyme required for sulfatase activity